MSRPAQALGSPRPRADTYHREVASITIDVAAASASTLEGNLARGILVGLSQVEPDASDEINVNAPSYPAQFNSPVIRLVDGHDGWPSQSQAATSTFAIWPDAPRRARGGTVIWLWDGLEVSGPGWARPWGSLRRRLRLSLALARADFVACTSHALMEDLERYLRIPKPKLRFMPVGCARVGRLPLAAVRAARSHYQLPERYFCCVARRGRRANLKPALAAWRQLARSGQIGLVICHQGLAPAHSEQGLVQLGDLGDGDLDLVLGGAIATVHPQVAEAAAYWAVRSMAVGSPAIAAEDGCNAEIIGPAGVLVGAADIAALAQAMEGFAVDSHRRAEFSQASLARAQTLSWRRSVEVMLRLLRQAAK